MFQFVFSFLFIVMGPLTSAHEGHHDIPGEVASKMQGQVKSTKELFVEVKEEKGKLKVLIFDHDRKNIDPSQIKLQGTVQLPKQKKKESLKFEVHEGLFVAQVTAPKTHRYSLQLKVGYQSENETLNYNIEPE